MLICGRSSHRVRTILTSSDVVCASRISLSSARPHCRSYHACATPDLSCCSSHHLHPLRLCHHASCTTQTSPVVPSLTAIPSGYVVTPLTPSKSRPLSFAFTVPSPRLPPHLPDLPSSLPRVNTKKWYRRKADLWAELGDKYHSAGKNLLKGIGKGCLRSAVRHRSAKGLFALLKERFSGMHGDVARCNERTS
jgi:hypothetical protein